MNRFKVVSKFKESEDQKSAINMLVKGVEQGEKYQTLLGVTGSGKTFSMAKIIENVQKPSLVLTHNKTLAAQLYREFKDFFPGSAVEYFVSYYDYYQPEAYVASSDLYIEKDASINDELDRLRLKATTSILERRDVIVVSSVSCIYGIGTPEEYEKSHIRLKSGDTLERDSLLRELVSIYYERNNTSFTRGTFTVKGDIVEIYPAYLYQDALRIEFFGDEIDRISRIHPVTRGVTEVIDSCFIYPAKHFVSSRGEMAKTIQMIEDELEETLLKFKKEGKLVEAQRLETRTKYDMEMMLEMGYCSGIENYSRIISRREPGERPSCLLDYFKGDYLMFIDESHISIPQIRGMYKGDRSRKMNLVEHGFRLPSALDNRPLYFEEFENILNQLIFVSATPADYEDDKSTVTAEQVIRPTGLLDPVVEIRPAKNQIDDLLMAVNERIERSERTLVTTLTKKMAEDLSQYFIDSGIKTKYIHSEIDTIERVEIIRDLRKGEFDCLIGINLLREGLDMPEVSLVAILDADKEGFLRSKRSLIQTFGRAARNVHGTVIMYADRITGSMHEAIDETNRRRKIQEDYNIKNNIKPETISKEIVDIIERDYNNDYSSMSLVADYTSEYRTNNPDDMKDLLERLREDMLTAAENLEFEKAAVIRDQMLNTEKKMKLRKKSKHGR